MRASQILPFLSSLATCRSTSGKSISSTCATDSPPAPSRLGLEKRGTQEDFDNIPLSNDTLQCIKSEVFRIYPVLKVRSFASAAFVSLRVLYS